MKHICGHLVAVLRIKEEKKILLKKWFGLVLCFSMVMCDSGNNLCHKDRKVKEMTLAHRPVVLGNGQTLYNGETSDYDITCIVL